MSRAKIVEDGDGLFYGVSIRCPGCKHGHVLPVRWIPPERTESPKVQGEPHWDFNGDFDRPTFSPSILSTCHDPDGEFPDEVCHSFVTDGRIQFLGDCTHALAGQTVDLPEVGE